MVQVQLSPQFPIIRMKKTIKKNKKQRLLFQYFELRKLSIKAIIYNKELPFSIRTKIQQKNFRFDLNSSITRIKNRCILTGRARSISKMFKLSRLQFRLLASNNFLPGVHKYNW